MTITASAKKDGSAWLMAVIEAVAQVCLIYSTVGIHCNSTP